MIVFTAAMRTVVVVSVVVTVFVFCYASEDSDTGSTAAFFNTWLADFVANLRDDVKAFAELLRVAGSLVNRDNVYALEGHEDYEKSSRIQKKWT